MALKDNIRKKRLELELTLEDVAQYIGVSRQTVNKYENGIVLNIPSDKVEKMAKLFHCSPVELMGWADEQGIPTKQAYDNLDSQQIIGVDKDGKPVYEISPENKKAFLDAIRETELSGLIKDKLELPDEAQQEIEFFINYIVAKYNSTQE